MLPSFLLIAPALLFYMPYLDGGGGVATNPVLFSLSYAILIYLWRIERSPTWLFWLLVVWWSLAAWVPVIELVGWDRVAANEENLWLSWLYWSYARVGSALGLTSLVMLGATIGRPLLKATAQIVS